MTLLPLYNQDRLDDATFVGNFVARHSELAALLASLRATAKGGATRHEIIVGARGMGKTSLLRRVAIAVGADEELARNFVALRFREEQYNVISLAAFWRNCCDALAEWCEAAGRADLAKRLDDLAARPAKSDGDEAETVFLETCRTLGRRAVLLLDNLDLILDNLKDENWRLRGALQSAGGPVVIGGATQLPSQSGDRDAPFYEFFNPHILEPLSETELLACLRALAAARGEKGAPVLELLARAPERALTLYALSGGNPRVLALIYQLLERADSHEIFADLEALLDQVTPFYKARVEEYSGANQRAVIDAVALNWDPITSGEIEEKTGIPVTTISPLLQRLRRDGFIEEMQGSGARPSYQLAERFLNIWYLMRHGTRQTRQKLRWLTLFLTRLFSEPELERMVREGEHRQGGWRAEWHVAVREAHAEVLRAKQDSWGDRAKVIIGRLESWIEALKRAVELFEEADVDGSLEVLNAMIASFDNSSPLSTVLVALYLRGFALESVDRISEALAAYDEALSRAGDADSPKVQKAAAQVLNSKGRVLADHFGRYAEAEEAYRRGAELAPESDMLCANLAWLLIETGRSNEAATLLAGLSTLAPEGRALLDAGLEIAADNYGSGVAHLGAALDMTLEDGKSPFFEDLLRLLRLTVTRGYGERMLDWFKESGNADRYAPVYGALVARVRGEKYLRDLNPEVRRFAEKFYDFLSRPKQEELPPPKKRARSRQTRR